MSIRIVLHQTHDRAGAPAPAVHVIEVTVPSMQASSEAILDIIRPFAPRETGRSGAYWYRSDGGIGWLEIVGSHRLALEELDDAVRTLEIAESLGEPEVYRQTQLGVYSASAPRTTNPYTLMAVGVAMYGFAGWLVVQLVRLLDEPAIVGMLCILIATLVFVGAWVIVNGARRRSWWHRARAEAKRLGRGIPENLQILSQRSRSRKGVRSYRDERSHSNPSGVEQGYPLRSTWCEQIGVSHGLLGRLLEHHLALLLGLRLLRLSDRPRVDHRRHLPRP